MLFETAKLIGSRSRLPVFSVFPECSSEPFLSCRQRFVKSRKKPRFSHHSTTVSRLSAASMTSASADQSSFPCQREELSFESEAIYARKVLFAGES